tara:strand:- start:28371 stop:30404 length:2034 start_codon:yes stop_codon:yes gene_type:complete
MKQSEWDSYWDKKINEHFNVKPAERIVLREFVENVFNEKYGIVGEKKKDEGILAGLSGVQGEAIYEAMVYVIAKIPGNRTLPTVEDVDSYLGDSEMRSLAKKWMKSKLKTDPQELMETIQMIGGDVKKIPNVPWGPELILISDTIDDYYKATPPEYGAPGRGGKVKANTADMVIVISGTKEEVLNTLKTKSVSSKKIKGGVISSNDGKTKWIQASIKKSKEGARVGKGSAIMNDKFGQQAMMPASLVKTFMTKMSQGKLEVMNFQSDFLEKVYANAPEIADQSVDQVRKDIEEYFNDKQKLKAAFSSRNDEAKLAQLAADFAREKYGSIEESDLSEGVLSSIKSMVSKGVDYAKNFLKKVFVKTATEITNDASKAASQAEKTDANKAAAQLAQLLEKGSGEEDSDQLNEADIPINDGFMRDVTALSNVILKENMVDQEFDLFLKQLKEVQKKIPGGVRLMNSGDTLQKIEGDSLKQFKEAATAVLKFANKERKQAEKEGRTPVLSEELKRGLYNKLVKVTVNFASYQTFNQVLDSVLSKGQNIDEMRKSLLELSADMIADAKFGDTNLPLWIVYGMGDGAHNLGTISDYKEKIKSSDKFAQMDYPYIVFAVQRSNYGKEIYNSVYMNLMVDVQEDEEGTIEPMYVQIQFINRQSFFSYKMDSSKVAPASKLGIGPNK